jgi:hypothetical protein
MPPCAIHGGLLSSDSDLTLTCEIRPFSLTRKATACSHLLKLVSFKIFTEEIRAHQQIAPVGHR